MCICPVLNVALRNGSMENCTWELLVSNFAGDAYRLGSVVVGFPQFLQDQATASS
jgi:hypothetical protein